MSALANTHPTLLDFAKRLDPNGKVDTVVEILNQTNGVLEDLVFQEGNLPTGHRTTIRVGLPEPTWRKLNYGVVPDKSETAQVTDSCGMLEAYAEVDKALADLNGNTAAFRLSEDRAHIESMNKEFARAFFYENEKINAERITGLTPRYDDPTAASYENVIVAGSNPSTSIWLCVFSPNTIHGIFPKGSKAGISVSDKGQQTAPAPTGGIREIYRTHYRWDSGVCVRDWRYAVRIRVDLNEIVKDGSTGPVLADLMGKAMRRIPNLSMGRAAFYCNRDVLDAIDLQQNNMKQIAFKTVEDAQGKLVDTFRRIPIRQCDVLLNTES